MEIAFKIALFVSGSVFSLFLVPSVEQRKYDYQRKQSLKEVYIELDDLQEELNAVIESFFDFLYSIRTEDELVKKLELKVPFVKEIDVSFMVDLYMKTSTELTQPQRKLIKSIPKSIQSILDAAEHSTDSVLNKNEYCITSIKNTIKLSCYLVHQINSLRNQQERYQENQDFNSNHATVPVLKSLGFNQAQVEISKIEESDFE